MKALTGIAAAEFARRRRQLMRMAGEDAILVLPAAPERVRSHDTHYPYRQDSDFWYLSGFPEPDAVLVLVPGRKHGEAILFCRERDPEREGWDGPRAGQDGAVNDYGMDDAYPIDDLDEILPGLLEGRSRVYYHFGRDADFDLKLIGWVRHVRAHVKQGAQPPHEFLELGHLLHELRLFKSKDEIKLMRRAADISVAAHAAAMRAVRASASCASTRPSNRLMPPMNSATKRVDGYSYSAAGVDTCTIRPASIMMVRLPSASALFMLWVIIMVLSRCSRTVCTVIASTFSAVAGSSAAVCSSSKSSLGLAMVAISRVMACRWPPESRPTFIFMRSFSPMPKAASLSRRMSVSRFCSARASGKRLPRVKASARFSAMVMSGAVPLSGS